MPFRPEWPAWRRIAMCVPAPGGTLNPAVLAAARIAGVDEIYRIGGAQAVAALAFGTQSIPPVDRIVGPGNAYVAEAKRQVFGRVGIDSIAGPSEVVILAEPIVPPRIIALDLLAQAEHDEVAQSILIVRDAALARSVEQAVQAELVRLPRAAIAGASWAHTARSSWCATGRRRPRWSTVSRPSTSNWSSPPPNPSSRKVRHAGAVFLGADCPEAVGDYVAGPNHVLPTGRTARFASGLSVFDFLKRTTYAQADRAALQCVGPAAVLLAQAEGLDAHARSIAARLDPDAAGTHVAADLHHLKEG